MNRRHVEKNDEEVLMSAFGNAEVLQSDMRFERYDEDDEAFVPLPSQWLADLPFKWTAPDGLATKRSVARVRKEFVAARKLSPVRVMVHGPPASGKTLYASRIAASLHVPHITVGAVIDEALQRDDATSEKLRAILSAQAETGGKRGKSAVAAQKRGGNGKRGDGGSVSARNLQHLLRARLPAKVVGRLVKAKLRSAACRNKGFVIDGYPRTLAESRALFYERRKADGDDDNDGHNEGDNDGGDGDEEEKENDDDENDGDDDAGDDEKDDDEGSDELTSYGESENWRFDVTTICNRVVNLQTSQEAAAQWLRALPEADVVATHTDEAGFKRRWANFQIINSAEMEPPMAPLVVLPHIETLDIDAVSTAADGDDDADANDVDAQVEGFTAKMLNYINSGGVAFNYHPTLQHVASVRAAAATAADEKAAAAAATKAQDEASEAAARAAQNESNAVRHAQVLVEDQEMVEACSLPLRAYLMDNVIPALVDGLLDTCKVKPVDPIDYLAEYLFRYSVGMPPKDNAPSSI
jgi:adenylate kinase